MSRRERAMTLAREHFAGGIRVYQHVDDLTQVMWAKHEDQLAGNAYKSVRVGEGSQIKVKNDVL